MQCLRFPDYFPMWDFNRPRTISLTSTGDLGPYVVHYEMKAICSACGLRGETTFAASHAPSEHFYYCSEKCGQVHSENAPLEDSETMRYPYQYLKEQNRGDTRVCRWFLSPNKWKKEHKWGARVMCCSCKRIVSGMMTWRYMTNKIFLCEPCQGVYWQKSGVRIKAAKR
jgi:hypothetical protein